MASDHDSSDASGRERLHPMPTRRWVLRTAGVGAVGLAGCLGEGSETDYGLEELQEGDDDRGGESGGGSPPPRAEELCRIDDGIDGGPLAVEFDSQARFRCAGEPLDNMEDLDRWTVTAGTVEADTEEYTVGTQSARLRAGPDDERVLMYRGFSDGIDLSDRVVSVAVDGGESFEWFALTCQLMAPDLENYVEMRHGVSVGGWHRLDFGPTETVGDPDLTDVREVALTVYTGGGRDLALSVDALRTVERATDQGRVLFTFDDGLVSQYETAYELMDEYEFPGLVCPITSFVGTEGFVSLEQLEEMRDAGWDVSSHPQAADPVPEYPPGRQEEMIRENKEWLVENGFERGARHIVWPYSAVDATSLDVANRYHSLGFCAGGCPSGLPYTDPLTVSRVDGDDVENSKRAIERAAEYGRTAVVMYHPVGTDDRATRPANHITRDEFRRVLAFVDDLDIEVVTASDLWERHASWSSNQARR